MGGWFLIALQEVLWYVFYKGDKQELTIPTDWLYDLYLKLGGYLCTLSMPTYSLTRPPPPSYRAPCLHTSA